MTDEGKRLEEEINQGSLLTDHPYVPRRADEPWGLCVCGLGEAAHAESKLPYRPKSLKAKREAPTPAKLPEGRVVIQYDGGSNHDAAQSDGDAD